MATVFGYRLPFSMLVSDLREFLAGGSRSLRTRKAGAAKRRPRALPHFEKLEDRWMPALNPLSWNQLTGTLTLSGTGNDSVVVRPDASPNTVDVIDNGGTPQTFGITAATDITNIVFSDSTSGVNHLSIQDGVTTASGLSVSLVGVQQFDMTSTASGQTVSVNGLTGALTLGTSSLAGNLTVTASGGITQAANASLTIGGDAAFTATNGAISLLNVANAFGGNVSLANSGANGVSLTNNQALVLGNVTVPGGNLTTTARSGGISQAANASITVAGTSTFNAAAGAINLGNAGNAFTGAVGLMNTGGNDATLNNNRALILGAASIPTGNLTVTANGAISQAANTTLAVGGDASFSATGGAISLSNANALAGNVSLTNTGAYNVTVRDNRALVLGNASVPTGALSVSAAGDIGQASGASLTVGGAASFS